MSDTSFIRLAGLAAILTALTTIGVHYVSFPAETFEQRLALAHHTGYIAHRWMIILHCFCVILSMLGIALLFFKNNRGLFSLGFLFYTVFGIAEMTRMFSVLEYLNPLRIQYGTATDETMRILLRQSIDHFSLAGNTLFAVFAFAFMIGNLCYGLALSRSTGSTRWIGYGFLFWACMGLAGLTNDYFQLALIEKATELNAKIFQPLFRFVVGIWILRTAREHVISMTAKPG
jgi:hypothetical protein